MVIPRIIGYDTENRAILVANFWRKEEEIIV